MTLTSIDPKKVRPLAGCITRPFTMSGASQLGRLVYPSADDVVSETDAADSATVDGAVGMIVGGSRHSTDGLVVDGETVSVCFFGPVVVGNQDDAVLDVTANYFAADVASTVKGRIGDAAGSASRRIGNPLTTTILFFNGADISAPAS